MFKELVPVLRDRAVLLTVTLLDEDQIRVNIVPKKLKDGDNDALTTPLSVTGTAEELDTELSKTIVGFVGAHLQMKNTLEKAKAEMDAASKAAQAEARAKSKTTTKPEALKTETRRPAATAKPAEPVKPAPQKTASLFDLPVPAATPTAAPDESEEDDEPFVAIEDDEPVDETEELDDAA
jgi:PRTRC genetic system protein E